MGPGQTLSVLWSWTNDAFQISGEAGTSDLSGRGWSQAFASLKSFPDESDLLGPKTNNDAYKKFMGRYLSTTWGIKTKSQSAKINPGTLELTEPRGGWCWRPWHTHLSKSLLTHEAEVTWNHLEIERPQKGSHATQDIPKTPFTRIHSEAELHLWKRM